MQDLIVATNPKSSFAEAVKLIKTNITFSSIGTNFKVILVTSPESGDGKSFLIANLASAFAQEGKRILIVDADLRKGRQHRIFGLDKENNHGYSNLILKVSQDQRLIYSGLDNQIFGYIKETQVKGVSLLPAGPTPPNHSSFSHLKQIRLFLLTLRNTMILSLLTVLQPLAFLMLS